MTYRAEIRQDEWPESPRAGDNLGTIYAPHRRYTLSDKDAVDPRELNPASIAVRLQVWMYEHGGIVLSTRSFAGRAQHADWDSGQVGEIYITKETARKEYGKKLTPAVLSTITRVLEQEIETYSQFLNGEVYRFTVYEEHDCASCGQTSSEAVESCGGFYGSDPKTNGMADLLDGEMLAALLAAAD